MEDYNSDEDDLCPLSLTLAQMLATIMHNNYFEYHSQFFRQIEGLAMGTNCAVSVANLYMAVLIDSKLKNLPGIRLYSRYIDDICFIFKGSRQDLDRVISYANSINRKLSFTHVTSRTQLDVLDVTFYQSNHQIHYKTYQKPANKYLYLPYFSNHPPATIRGFIKGELIRYNRTNSQFQNELAMRNLFYDRLLTRGYPRSYLLNIFNDPSTFLPSTNTRPLDTSTALYIIPYINSPKVQEVRSYINNLNDQILPPPTLSASTVWSVLPSLSKLLLKSKLTLEQSNYLRSNNFDLI